MLPRVVHMRDRQGAGGIQPQHRQYRKQAVAHKKKNRSRVGMAGEYTHPTCTGSQKRARDHQRDRASRDTLFSPSMPRHTPPL